MIKEKGVEEKETSNEDAEELFVEILKYNVFIELHSGAQLLKTMLYTEACYPRLMEEIKV